MKREKENRTPPNEPRSPLKPKKTALKLSEAIIHYPRCLTNQGTKLSLVNKSLVELDNPES